MSEKIYLSKFDRVESSYPYFIVTSFPERYIKHKPKYKPILQLEAGDILVEEKQWTKKFEYFLVGEKRLFNINMPNDSVFMNAGTITLSISWVILKSGKQLTAQQLNETPELIIESH